MLHFIDFEVFKNDWLCVIANPMTKTENVIVNDPDELTDYYNEFKDEIFIGYNIRNYDQWIFKGILAGFNPYEINEHIITQGLKGYQFSNLLYKYKLITFDLLQKDLSLKQLEAFQGHSIYESTVDFRLDRKLTDEEIQETIKYCKNDVQEAINLFSLVKSDFDSRLELITEFKLPLDQMSRTNSQVIANILGAEKNDYFDEFDLTYPAYLDNIKKYKNIVQWYKNTKSYDDELKTVVAGVPHIFAWGGLHGAKAKYSGKGYYLHIDVNSYYPSLMITHNYFSRSVPEDGKERFKWVYGENLRLKSIPELKRKRGVYKLICNSTYGCFKDKYNTLYDPLMANNICVTGQLALLLLIEMLEQHVELIQSNTDGLIVKLPTLDTYDIVDDVCYEWEKLTGVKLSFDPIITKIYQKDVNNYLFIDETGAVESKGAYVKPLTSLDNDLPIVNKALREYFINGTSIENTINNCDNPIEFQKIVKLSSKYHHVEHYGKCYYNKCYRVFATTEQFGCIYKVKIKGNKEKISNTPENCIIWQDDITDKKLFKSIDKSWYIEMANKRLKQFIGGV